MSNKVTLDKIRQQLRENNVKLWSPPYTVDGKADTDELLSLAGSIASFSNIEIQEVVAGLEELRQHAVEKFQQNEKFKTEHVATLRVRLAGNQPTTCEVNYKLLETTLDIDGKMLTDKVCELFQLNTDIKTCTLKLIHRGKLINDDQAINSQDVKHNGIIMCIAASMEERGESTKQENQLNEVEKARKGAELLATKSGNSKALVQVQIADQNGRSLTLPEDERKSLTVALGLHEKGRAILKRKEFSSALLILLEADLHFKNCRSDILQAVDNYAVLCLDIVWCYVMLRDVNALPDAGPRLIACEESLKRSYGDSLVRLLAIKGSSGNEISLYVRLYLLQAIVHYHNNLFNEASEKLNKAEGFAGVIRVDAEKINEMMVLGFTQVEARTALRACNCDVGRATQYAFQQREEKEKVKTEENAKHKIQRNLKKYGGCRNGMEINPQSFENLMSMGFDDMVVAEALKLHNNNVEKALDEIQLNYDKLSESALKTTAKKYRNEKARQLVEMGFAKTDVLACLKTFEGDLERSFAYLTENKVAPDEWKHDLPSTSSSKSKITEEEAELMHEAAQVLDHDEKEYLDITLDDECDLMLQYKGYLASINSQ